MDASHARPPVGAVPPPDTIPVGILVAAAILRASGHSLEQAAREASVLEVLIRRGPVEVADERPF